MSRSPLSLVARAVVYAVLAAAASGLNAEPKIPDAIFSDESGQAYFADVLREAWFGLSKYERAAFIVRDESGGMRCELWPSDHEKLEESFRGSIPKGTIAIVHTHPLDSPLPSANDERVADRLHLPVYVLTRGEITRALPGSSRPEIVTRDGFWFKPALKKDVHCGTAS